MLGVETIRAASSTTSREEILATYLPYSDSVLISRNAELKLVSREAGGRREFFEDPMSTYFGNRIHEPNDEVRLFI